MAVLLKISGSSNVIVADNHSAIAANLDNLQKLATAGEISSIQITDGLTLSVSAAQVRQDAKSSGGDLRPLSVGREGQLGKCHRLHWLSRERGSGGASPENRSNGFQSALTDIEAVLLRWRRYCEDQRCLFLDGLGAFPPPTPPPLRPTIMSAGFSSATVRHTSSNICLNLKRWPAARGPRWQESTQHPMYWTG